jgi:hypothetical protein
MFCAARLTNGATPGSRSDITRQQVVLRRGLCNVKPWWAATLLPFDSATAAIRRLIRRAALEAFGYECASLTKSLTSSQAVVQTAARRLPRILLQFNVSQQQTMY